MCSYLLLYWDDKDGTWLPGQKGNAACLLPDWAQAFPSPAGRARVGRLKRTGKNTPKRTLWGLVSFHCLRNPLIYLSDLGQKVLFVIPRASSLPASSPQSLQASLHLSLSFPSSLWASPHLSSLAYIQPTFSIHIISWSFKPIKSHLPLVLTPAQNALSPFHLSLCLPS